MKRRESDRKNLLAINLGLAANAVLAALKTLVGIVGNSPALLADGINSTSDVAYLTIVRVFMGKAQEPPDREHPFGHRQLESIAALVIGSFVMTTGIAIFWNAVSGVYDLAIGRSQFVGAEPAALWVALFTVLLKIGLFAFTRRVGRQTGSLAVLALARDHRNDVFSISTAAVGIFFGREGYPWVDPLAASIVAVIIFYTGVRILLESSFDLMNVLVDQSVVERVRLLLQTVPGIREVEEVEIHQIGLYLMVDVTVGIDGTLTVAEGDAIASRAEDVLRDNLEYLRQVSVHYHPARHGEGSEPARHSIRGPDGL